MPKSPLRILIVAALSALSLIGLVVRESMARAAGTEVLLAMEAIDPRALLGGHYVTVGLVETLPEGEACPPGAAADEFFIPNEVRSMQSGQTWLALRPNGERHSLSGIAHTRQEALALGPLAAIGSAGCGPPMNGVEAPPPSPTRVRLTLGIDRFYINQTDAERIDRLLRAQTVGEEQRIFAIVSIGQDGRARLLGLQIDGERLELSWL